MSEEKRGPGRPKIELDTEVLIKLAELQCNLTEIAYVMGVSKDTLKRNYSEEIEIGKAQGKIKLRRAMFRNACENDNAAVQIFLSKNLLGYSDSPNNSDDDSILPWEGGTE